MAEIPSIPQAPNLEIPNPPLPQIGLTAGPNGLRLASTTKRFFNLVIDSFIIRIIAGLLATAMAATMWSDSVSLFLIFIFLDIVYYTIMESHNGKSIGKYFTKTTVLMNDGTKPEMGVILKRSFCRWIPFEPLSYLASHTGWHDRFSATVVVDDEISK